MPCWVGWLMRMKEVYLWPVAMSRVRRAISRGCNRRFAAKSTMVDHWMDPIREQKDFKVPCVLCDQKSKSSRIITSLLSGISRSERGMSNMIPRKVRDWPISHFASLISRMNANR